MKQETGVAMGPFAALSAVIRAAATHRLRPLALEAGVDLALGWITAPLKWFDVFLPLCAGSTLGAGAFYFVGSKS